MKNANPSAKLSVELYKALKIALLYDPIQAGTLSEDSIAAIVQGELRRVFDESVLVPRRVERALDTNCSAGIATVFVGDPGQGKTSVMLSLRHTYRSRYDPANWDDPAAQSIQIVYVNLLRLRNRVKRLSSASERQNLMQQECVARLSQELRTSNAPAFADYPTEKEIRESPSLASEILQRFQDDCHSHQHQAVFLIDNIDQLSTDTVSDAAEAVGDIADEIGTHCSFVIASRPSTYRRVTARANHLPAERIDLMDFGRETATEADVRLDLENIETIVERRLRIFHDESYPSLWRKIESFIENSPELRSEKEDLAAIRKRLRALLRHIQSVCRTVMQDYFLIQSDTRSKSRIRFDLTITFDDWHNGSLREMMHSFYAFVLYQIAHNERNSAIEPVDLVELGVRTGAGSIELYRPGAVRDLRTSLFRHLVFTNAPTPTVGRHEVHPSLAALYRPSTQGSPTFKFVPLRILQYLAHREERKNPPPTVRRLTNDFARFEVEEAPILEQLHALQGREGYHSGFLNLGSPTEPLNLDEIDDLDLVHLDRAGLMVTKRLLGVLEFQYWCAATNPSARTIISDALGLKADDLDTAEFFNSEQNRVDVALSFLADYLLPELEREHKYLKLPRGSGVSPAAREGLALYCRLFGFKPDYWMLTENMTEIRNFARTSKVGVTMDVARVERISGAIGRLDEIYDDAKRHELV